MSNLIITKVAEDMNELPDSWQQQVLQFVETLRQQHLQISGNAWDVLESLTAQLKPHPIGQPNMTITSTAPQSASKPSYESRYPDE